ncbi:MAG: outer membrane protein assembly factor BamB family protein [Ktedonobacteraceae bacterium]
MKSESIRTIGKWVRQNAHIGMVTGLLLLLSVLFAPTALAATGDWPTYVSDGAHDGYNSAETVINPSTAPNLKLKWTHSAGGGISTQPVEANKLVYWGSWDGYEHATNLSGGFVWSNYLGQTTDTSCNPVTVGVASTATIATVSINGVSTSVDFVGGGNANFYALNAMTGKTIWQTSLGSSPSHFLWGSPTIYNGNLYEGVASYGDCPLVQGQVVMMNGSTGAIEHVFDTVPNGCVGAGVWGAPTIDPATGWLFVVTGNGGPCGSAEPYQEAMIKLNAADLSYVTSWQVPASQQGNDTDFGDTPTFFTATINGTSTPMVGVGNKNGIYYAFNRNLIHTGPVWEDTLAAGGDCPLCGDGIISPSAFDGQTLYIGAGKTTINGANCAGGLRAVNPANGNYIWEHCMTGGPILGAVSVVPGVVAITEGTYLIVVDAKTSATLFRYHDTGSGSLFYGSPSISRGVLYVGNMDGHLYALAP